MTKAEFYNGKAVIETEWWLNAEWLPELVRGRVRVFNDGTADACLAEGVTVYGFENREYAGHFLSQDDLSRFSAWSEEDVQDHGLTPAEIEPPTWVDPPDQEFVYAGTYPTTG